MQIIYDINFWFVVLTLTTLYVVGKFLVKDSTKKEKIGLILISLFDILGLCIDLLN